jgi:ParB-like chromosome segregation protein Spo0J
MLIPMSNLRLTDSNPRHTKTSKQADAELIASLQHYGQLTSVLVRPSADGEGIFDIIEGGRRFKLGPKAGLSALKAELYEGSFTPAEIGTAANYARADMHPLDQAAVITCRLADGEHPADIAGRFGHPERWAIQRAKLDGLSDRAKKLFRNDAINLAAAEALTLVDPAAQDAYLKRAREEWMLHAPEIRRQLTGSDLPAALALFDLALYPPQAIRRDLFSEDVWLTDREAFNTLQTEALNAKVEAIKAEGWADVQLIVNPTYEFQNQHVAIDGRVPKANRGRFLAFVTYNSHSGHVDELRGYTTRKALKQASTDAKRGKAKPEDVPAQTCRDLNDSQQYMIGALLTRGIAHAIANGDTWLALKTILQPLMAPDRPAWSGLQSTAPNYVGANVMFDDKIEQTFPKAAPFPSRTAFDNMPWHDVMNLVRGAALRAMDLLTKPNAEAVKILRDSDIAWFRYDAGFLRRYRLDALQDLARHLKVPSAGLKKSELVNAILAQAPNATFNPVKATG